MTVSFRMISVLVMSTGWRKSRYQPSIGLRVKTGPLSIVLPVEPLFFREGLEQISLGDARKDFDKQGGQDEGSGKSSGGEMKRVWTLTSY